MPGVAQVQQDVLAEGVLEVLRDRGWRTRWAARARRTRWGRRATRHLGPSAPSTSKRGLRPGAHGGPERRHRGQHRQRLVERPVVGRDEVGAEVGRLHRPGPAAGGHGQPGSSQVLAQPGGRDVLVGARSTAWPPITPTRPAVTRELGQGVVDRVVVQRLRELVGQVACGRATSRRRGRRAWRRSRRQAGVELLRGVEGAR